MYPLGLVVFSKSGRDKRKPFVVVSAACDADGEYLYLVDGDMRKLDKPKKKKSKHVQVTKFVALDIQKKLQDGERILDAEIRKILLPYASSSKGVTELVER